MIETLQTNWKGLFGLTDGHELPLGFIAPIGSALIRKRGDPASSLSKPNIDLLRQASGTVRLQAFVHETTSETDLQEEQVQQFASVNLPSYERYLL